MKNIAPGIIISLILLVAIGLISEAYLRVTTPFTENTWPTTFHPQAGPLLQPHAIIRTTNHLDFWTEQKVNSLGFLDHEPAPGKCHVTLIGDSFIEAHQVTLKDKVQTKLAELAKKTDMTISAFGQSDTGQANQLVYYDLFAKNQHPKIVIITFVSNDFSNNSRLLTSLVHGTHPDHPRRHFIDKSVDKNWADHMLPRPKDPAPSEGTPPIFFHSWAMQNSYAYQWLFRKFQRLTPTLATLLAGKAAPSENRMEAFTKILKTRPEYQKLFSDWNPITDPDTDAPFAKESLLSGFEEELKYTGLALDAWQERAKADNFHLAILSTHVMKADNKPNHLFNRMKTLADERHIPIIDQSDYITQQGGKIRNARFRHDGHWSPQGHQWAAEAIWEYTKSKNLCASD